MINLLTETIEELKRHNKTGADVTWVGSRDGEYFISWGEFIEIAKQVNYDNGYGGEEIATDLVVVGDDWWLERGEYDGSEWWEYKSLPARQLVSAKPITQVNGWAYPTVEGLN